MCFYKLQLVANKQMSFTESEQEVLKPHSTIPFSTWKQVLQAGVAEKYKGSDSCKRVTKALEVVFKQYGKLTYGDKVDMVTNVIVQNRILYPKALPTKEQMQWCKVKVKREIEQCRKGLEINGLLKASTLTDLLLYDTHGPNRQFADVALQFPGTADE
ncbi:hypothetical protein L210DRAFT_3499535 [Boletus edulis BED1]|uniref:Uncharacterized protein n=1 Tax=Boletus edulis BED1 TaxID=1328754 RepID=A0AAD4C9R5_BOLED|nr:hypothetical protein L210DRAFT_3499535 [Boletus edulis BED1]